MVVRERLIFERASSRLSLTVRRPQSCSIAFLGHAHRRRPVSDTPRSGRDDLPTACQMADDLAQVALDLANGSNSAHDRLVEIGGEIERCKEGGCRHARGRPAHAAAKLRRMTWRPYRPRSPAQPITVSATTVGTRPLLEAMLGGGFLVGEGGRKNSFCRSKRLFRR